MTSPYREQIVRPLEKIQQRSWLSRKYTRLKRKLILWFYHPTYKQSCANRKFYKYLLNPNLFRKLFCKTGKFPQFR